jgi:hypothetical protein
MTVTYIAALKDTRMTAVITSLDGGTGNASIDIGTAGMATVLVNIPLSKPSFTESGQAITMAGAPKSAAATATGTAAAARIKDGAVTPNNTITGLTVTATGGGGDIQLSSTSINSGQTVQLTSAVINHG